MFRPISAIIRFSQLLCYRVLYKCLNRVVMLRSHHHLRGFIQTSFLCEWMLVYPVGYIGVGFEGNWTVGTVSCMLLCWGVVM